MTIENFKDFSEMYIEILAKFRIIHGIIIQFGVKFFQNFQRRALGKHYNSDSKIPIFRQPNQEMGARPKIFTTKSLLIM